MFNNKTQLPGIKVLRSFRLLRLFKLIKSNQNLKRMLPWFRFTPVWCHQDHLWVPESNRVKIERDIHGIQRRLVMLEQFGVKPDGNQMEIFFDTLTLKKADQF